MKQFNQRREFTWSTTVFESESRRLTEISNPPRLTIYSTICVVPAQRLATAHALSTLKFSDFVKEQWLLGERYSHLAS